MRTLYFDIDGTLVPPSGSRAKTALADGALEKAVKQSGFGSLVCVGSAVSIALYLDQQKSRPDGPGLILGLCGGAFLDEAWFRSVLCLAPEPEHRALAIQQQADWYYLDDLAPYYLQKDDLEELFTRHRNGRILVPDPHGDGRDVMEWLERIPGDNQVVPSKLCPPP